MATYKVIQDIEATDKLVGPFGLRQFIYLLVVAFLLYVAYRVAELVWFLALPFLPPMIFFGLLALPIGGGQPTEVWLLAKLRFFVKPRRRLWDQNGVRELVTITVPKKVDLHLTKELSQTEVKSRLSTLASTLDSHGWAVKHIGSDPFAGTQAVAPASTSDSSDRLVNMGTPPSATPPTYTVTAEDDMLDEQNNPTAQKLGDLIAASTKSRRAQILSDMKKVETDPEPPTSSNPSTPPGGSQIQPTVPSPGSSIIPPSRQSNAPANDQTPANDRPLTEEELLNKIHAEQAKPKNYGHMRVIKPIKEQEAEARAAAAKAAAAAKTQKPDTDIIELARNNDLNVETVARQINKKKNPPKDEIVINLHDD